MRIFDEDCSDAVIAKTDADMLDDDVKMSPNVSEMFEKIPANERIIANPRESFHINNIHPAKLRKPQKTFSICYILNLSKKRCNKLTLGKFFPQWK